MNLSSIFQSFARNSKKKDIQAKEGNEQLEKAMAQYNLELQVAETITYITSDLMKNR
jgi:hypothetical protein